MGLDTDGTAAGERVYSYGNSSLRFGITQLSPKTGISLGSGGGWSHDVYTVSPGIPGDSGSAFLSSTGQAMGTLSTLQIAPLPAGNGVGDLSHELAYARATRPGRPAGRQRHPGLQRQPAAARPLGPVGNLGEHRLGLDRQRDETAFVVADFGLHGDGRPSRVQGRGGGGDRPAAHGGRGSSSTRSCWCRSPRPAGSGRHSPRRSCRRGSSAPRRAARRRASCGPRSSRGWPRPPRQSRTRRSCRAPGRTASCPAGRTSPRSHGLLAATLDDQDGGGGEDGQAGDDEADDQAGRRPAGVGLLGGELGVGRGARGRWTGRRRNGRRGGGRRGLLDREADRCGRLRVRGPEPDDPVSRFEGR